MIERGLIVGYVQTGQREARQKDMDREGFDSWIIIDRIERGLIAGYVQIGQSEV